LCSASGSDKLHVVSTDRRSSDEHVVEAQLGRAPRDPWSVAVRCGYGRPSVLVTGPVLVHGDPFPTLLWLSCPWLVESVGRLESAGGVARWRERISVDPDLAERIASADARYRAARAGRVEGHDPCADVGIAGQADPLATKCLHAHVASFLAGLGDPIGEEVVGQVQAECPDDRCAAFAEPARTDREGE